MSRKLTALICALGASAVLTAAAFAAPVPVAFYAFSGQSDVDAFSRGFGAKCAKKWSKKKQMLVAVGAKTNSCQFRTSVVGDSTDPGSDMEVTTTAVVARNTPRKLQKKAYVGVGTRVSESAGWELRVRPLNKSWQLFRDPKGPGGRVLARSGKGKFIRGIGRLNVLLLRSFDYGGPDTQVLAGINGKGVVALTDSSPSQPDGRRSVIVTGAKGDRAGKGIRGVFDSIAIKVPNPF